MSERKQSRDEWEQEIRDLQQNVIPHERLRNAYKFYRKVGYPTIPDRVHFLMFGLGGLLLGLGIATLGSERPYSRVISLLAVVVGCCLGFTAFRYKRKS